MPNLRTKSGNSVYRSRLPGQLGIGHDLLAPDGIAQGLLAEIMTFCREFAQAAFNPYHPERHYMRGPGPACAAKRKTSLH